MSPKAKHIPDDAYRTTIRLTEHELAAIHWIQSARRQRGNDRKTLNDILVDGLWLLLEKQEGKARGEIMAMVPESISSQPAKDNVRPMPKPRR